MVQSVRLQVPRLLVCRNPHWQELLSRLDVASRALTHDAVEQAVRLLARCPRERRWRSVSRAGWRRTDPVTTFSAGVAVHAADAKPAETFAAADRALYRAKDAGRDCVRDAGADAGESAELLTA